MVQGGLVMFFQIKLRQWCAEKHGTSPLSPGKLQHKGLGLISHPLQQLKVKASSTVKT